MTKHAQVRRRAPRTLAAGFLAAGLLAPLASAELPAALDRIPTDALAVVVAPSIDRVDKNAASLLTAVEMPAVTSPAQLLSVVGLSRGVDTTKPVALALMAGDLGGDVPPALLLLPVTDYAAVAQSLASADTTGALSAGKAAGEPVFIKQVAGGYAAISPVRSVLEKFTGDGGLLGAHRANIGARGERLFETSDVVLIANIPALAPMLEPAMEQAVEQMAMVAALQGAAMDNNPMEAAARNFLRDAQVAMVGLDASGMGLRISVAATFKEGSELARMMDGDGDSSRLLDRLPDQPYIVAFATDLGSPVMRTLVEAGAKQKLPGQKLPNGENVPAMPGMVTLLSHLTGQAGMILPNPAGLMGGLLARGVYFYESPQPDQVVDSYKQLITDLNGQSVAGLTYTGAFNADSTTIDSKKVSGYSLRVQTAPGSMAASAMSMVYGPAGGPSGFIAKAGSGVVVTTTPDQDLMKNAMARAAGGEAKASFASNAMNRQVRENLVKGRVFEMYLSPRSVLDQVLPFLAMMGQPIDQAAIPAQLPPVGMALAADDGSVQVDVFVPAPVIKTGVAIGQTLQGMMNRGGAQPRGAQNGNQPPF